jgi:rod shape-determining protein MreD
VAISIIRHIIAFILLAGLQVLVLNSLDISSYVNPQVYILFLLLLPVNTEIWFCLLAGFVSGGIVDGLSNTNGIHAFAGTALGYFRYFYIKYSLDKEEIERGMSPNLKNMPPTWHFFYILISSLLYHWLIYFMEAFTFSGLGDLTLKSISSGIIATFLLLLIGFLFSRKTTNV